MSAVSATSCELCCGQLGQQKRDAMGSACSGSESVRTMVGLGSATGQTGADLESGNDLLTPTSSAYGSGTVTKVTASAVDKVVAR